MKAIGMKPDMKEILAELERLRTHSRSDFCAVACLETGNQPIRWMYAAGNRNVRFRKLKHKTGEGLAGQVFRIGRPVLINAAGKPQAVRSEYPIMLVENLQTAAAFPIWADRRVGGVLLMGSRSFKAYGQDELAIAERSAACLAPLIPLENPIGS